MMLDALATAFNHAVRRTMTESEWLTTDDAQRMLNHLTMGVPSRPFSQRRYLLAGYAILAGDTPWRLSTPEETATRDLLLWAEKSKQPPARNWYTPDLLRRKTGPEVVGGLLSRAETRKQWASPFDPSFVPCAAILRCLFGNPFRPADGIRRRLRCDRCKGEYRMVKRDHYPVPMSICARCATDGPLWFDVIRGAAPHWLTPSVLSVAQAAYDEIRPDGTLSPFLLSVLADSLTDAGCDREDIIEAVRASVPCWRGFWALDLLLGKE